MLEYVLNNTAFLNDTTISGILLMDEQKYRQIKNKHMINKYKVFFSLPEIILEKKNIDEFWIFSDKNKETIIEKKYVNEIVEYFKISQIKYKYIIPGNTNIKNNYVNKIAIFVYHDIMNYSFIEIELYYKKMINRMGQTTSIINMPNEINELYNIYNYPFYNEFTEINMDKLRDYILNIPDDVVIFDVPIDLTSELSWKYYFSFYATLSQIITPDYSISCQNAEKYSDKQIDMLKGICRTFFYDIDDYFFSIYGRKQSKSHPDELERMMKYNKYDVINNMNYFNRFYKNVFSMDLKGYDSSFANFRNKVDMSIRPYTIII